MEDPGGIVSVIQPYYQAHIRINIGTASSLYFFSPVDMFRSGSVTGFTTYINFRPGSMVGLFTVGIVFSQVGGVALGTHVIPVLRDPGPVKYIIRRNAFVLINMKPALPSFTGGTGIPTQGKALVPSPWKGNQVLLQWPYAKHIGNLIIGHLAIRSFGMNHKSTFRPVKPGSYAKMCETDIIEITQYRFFGGRIHGHVMIRSLKKHILFFMAFLAALTPHICCSLFSPG
jgi:hypothetical protein